jgi:vacuolar-type H+-ATPase subunit F/Vma7
MKQEDSQYRLAIIGAKHSILLYRAFGVESFGVSNIEEAREKLNELVAENQGDEKKTPTYAVIFVEENFFREFPEDLLEKLARKPLPAVTPVPSPGGSEDDYSSERLRKIVERAVGSDILG